MIRISSPWVETGSQHFTQWQMTLNQPGSSRLQHDASASLDCLLWPGFYCRHTPRGSSNIQPYAKSITIRTAVNGIGLPLGFCLPNSRKDVQHALTSNWSKLPIRRFRTRGSMRGTPETGRGLAELILPAARVF